jgi:hypothetical protein
MKVVDLARKAIRAGKVLKGAREGGVLLSTVARWGAAGLVCSSCLQRSRIGFLVLSRRPV